MYPSSRRILPVLVLASIALAGLLLNRPGLAAPRVLEASAFEVKTGEWYYDPKELTVETSTIVTITLQHMGSTSIPHDIKFELDNGRTEASQKIRGGETNVLGFSAPAEPGEYVFYCSVGNHRSRGMEGKLIVTGPGGVLPPTATSTPNPEPSATELPPTPGSTPMPNRWWTFLPMLVKNETPSQR